MEEAQQVFALPRNNTIQPINLVLRYLPGDPPGLDYEKSDTAHPFLWSGDFENATDEEWALLSRVIREHNLRWLILEGNSLPGGIKLDGEYLSLTYLNLACCGLKGFPSIHNLHNLKGLILFGLIALSVNSR
jgi:hypothetical protein